MGTNTIDNNGQKKENEGEPKARLILSGLLMAY